MRTALAALAFVQLVASPDRAQTEVVLRPADAQAGSFFGESVALSGARLLVGAPGGTSAPGRAYVYLDTAAGWVEEATLQVPGAALFGSGVALMGDLAFVGAEGFVHSSGNASGAVFVFERSPTGWELSSTLLPSDVGTASLFGSDVEVQPGRLLVAEKSRAYVFEPVAGAWTEVAILLSGSDSIGDVALSGARVAIGTGAIGTGIGGEMALVFEKTASGWGAATELDRTGIEPLSYFGWTVAMEGERIAVLANAGFTCDTGTLHGFEHLPSGWRKSTLAKPFLYLHAAAMDQGRLAFAASDSLHVYRSLPSGGWVSEESHPTGVVFPPFGNVSVDIAGNIGVIGTSTDAVGGKDAGSVRVWRLRALSGLPESISVDSGGKQQLELRRGMHEPFSLYWIFGSASGTTPGLVVDGVPLPLNFDAYYLFLALNPNTVVDPTIGILDGIGSALPRIELPPLDPTLVGATLHHVALTFDLSNGPIVEFASNPVPLRFTTEADLVPQDFESGVDGWTLAAPVGGASWQLVQDGDCGAVTRMLAYTSAPPTCGGDLVAAISNARSMSPIFRLGQVGSYELRLTSMLTAGLDARIRLFLPGPPAVYFELAWPSDFTDTGALETLAFPVPGIEYAIGRDARFEFLLNGTPNSSPAGWWIDDVELVKLP